VTDIYPLSAVQVGTPIEVEIKNVASANLDLSWVDASSNTVTVEQMETEDIERLSQTADGQWESGVRIKFMMFNAVTSGLATVNVRVSTAVVASFDLSFVAAGETRVTQLSPLFGSVCGGGSITASFDQADSFSSTGMVLRFFGANSGEQIDASASSWESTTQQATFTVPQTLLATAGTQKVQVLLDSQSFESTNFTFDYTTKTARVASTSPRQKNKAITLIPSQLTQATINLEGLDVRTEDDLSLVMSGGGSTITLSHTYFTSTCTSSGCDVTIKFTPPQDTTAGTKTLLISSKSCSLSQAEVQLSIQSSTAEVVPSRAQAAGGETLSLYVVNAPTSSALPFDFSNVRVECGSSQATVTYVSPHTAKYHSEV